jgi:hypothetical protein
MLDAQNNKYDNGFVTLMIFKIRELLSGNFCLGNFCPWELLSSGTFVPDSSFVCVARVFPRTKTSGHFYAAFRLF